MWKKMIIICLILISSLYVFGFFHPKNIIVDEVEIISPKGMVINSIKFKTLNNFFILPFNYQRKYTLNKKETEINFTILNDIFNKHKILSFTIKKSSLISFNNFIKSASKENHLQKEESSKKYHIYMIQNDTIYTYYIYYQKLFITIFSNENLKNKFKNILRVPHQFSGVSCPSVHNLQSTNQ